MTDICHRFKSALLDLFLFRLETIYLFPFFEHLVGKVERIFVQIDNKQVTFIASVVHDHHARLLQN